MKSKKIVSLILFVAISCLFMTGCPRPKSTTITCTRNANGTFTCGVTIVYFAIQPDNLANQLSSMDGVLDLASPWQPDISRNASATVRLKNASGDILSQQDFPLMLSTNNPGNPISPVDSDTTPYTYVLQNPNAVNNYIGGQNFAGGDITDIEIAPNVPIKRKSGTFAPGDYSNHFRWRDSNGVTYVGDFILTIAERDGCTPRTSC